MCAGRAKFKYPRQFTIIDAAHALLKRFEKLICHVTQLLFQFLRFRYLGAGHDHAEPGGPVPIALTHRPDPM